MPPNIKDIDELHRVAITAIIYRGKDKIEYLITKRALTEMAFPGKWTVPGGKVSVNDYINTPETFPGQKQWYNAVEKTLRREVKEEVNLEIGTPGYVLDIALMRKDGIPVIILSFYAPYVSGEVKLDEDSIDHAWVTAEESKKYDLIPGIQEEIEMVETLLKEKKYKK